MSATLEAVNAALRSISQTPINNLEGQLSVDAAFALATLGEESRRIQAKGWHFNSDIDVTLTPTTGGDVFIPDNYLSVDVSTEYAVRGNRLYNKTDKTFVFDSPVEATVTRLFDFDELPEQAQLYIKASAVKKFHHISMGVTDLSPYIAQEFMEANLDFISWDNSQGDYNMGVNFDV